MNKLVPRNKIYFQNNKILNKNIKKYIFKLKKKKWRILKKEFFNYIRNQKIKQRILKRRKFYYLKKKYKLKSFIYKKTLFLFSKNNILNKKSINFNILKKKNIILKLHRDNQPQTKKKIFKERLLAKQQFKNFYGCIPEYQLKNLFFKLKKNKKKNINILNQFIILLESRIDIIIYRLKIASTIFKAKQLINHKKIKINNKIVSYQNYILKKGDIISFNTKKIRFKLSLINYIQKDKKKNLYIFLRKPFLKEIVYPLNLNKKLINEYFQNN